MSSCNKRTHRINILIVAGEDISPFRTPLCIKTEPDKAAAVSNSLHISSAVAVAFGIWSDR